MYRWILLEFVNNKAKQVNNGFFDADVKSLQRAKKESLTLLPESLQGRTWDSFTRNRKRYHVLESRKNTFVIQKVA